MKTVISKENAIAILEGVVIQQSTAVKLMDLSGSMPEQLFIRTTELARALFNINLDNASEEEYEEVVCAFTDTIEYGDISVTKKAEIIYRRMEILSRLENLKTE